MLTRAQDEALRVLGIALSKARGPAGEAAYLLVDAVRRGEADEQRERTEDLQRLLDPTKGGPNDAG